MTDQPPPDPTANFTRDEVQAAFDIFDEQKIGKIPATPEVLQAFLAALGLRTRSLNDLQVFYIVLYYLV